MKIGNFVAERKRRNVYKVAIAYAVVGWPVGRELKVRTVLMGVVRQASGRRTD